jgi:hypothetical protein
MIYGYHALVERDIMSDGVDEKMLDTGTASYERLGFGQYLFRIVISIPLLRLYDANVD